ncbi:MAG: ABC transporter permease [Phycisphaerae bacterium]|nr:ABC transporter permease [Phycisphaerae bacterium]
MRNTCVIAKRELASVLTSPRAYVIGAKFLALVGILFVLDFRPGMEASLRQVFSHVVWVLVLSVPLLTMALLSDEYARGTIETMMTAPVTEIDVALGKFFGVLGFYVLLLLTTLPHYFLLSAYSQPEFGQALMGYFGMMLVGGMFIAVGLFFSSLTKHQLLAALGSAAVLAIFTLLPLLLNRLVAGRVARFVNYVSVSANFDNFSKGIIDLRSLVFFLSMMLFFLFLSVKVLESRRWR